ncbi:MAG: hypothetical protein ACYTGL_17480, partial [Planctomycetota bacterium]
LQAREMLTADPLAEIAPLSDEFDDPNSIAEWQRINEVEGWNADQLQQWNVDQTQPGRMVMQPHTVVWYENWRGPMVFKEVAGDFVFTTEVHIGDRDDVGGSDLDDIPNDAAYSLGGLMIRTPRDITDPVIDWQPGSQVDDGTNNGENYVFLSLGHGVDGQFSFEVKTTRNSNSQLELTPLGQTANTATLRIARIGTAVITMYQFPGEDWTVHRRYDRPDMPETMQLGMVTYSDWNKASDFDPFLHNSTVLQPGVADPTPGEAFNPDLVAGFEYARFARPDVPTELAGVDLVNSASDEELLSFLGEDSVPEPDTPVVVGDQVMSRADDLLEFELPTELNGQPVEYYVDVIENVAAALNGDHGLYVFDDNFALNWGGQNEKWLQGDDNYFYLLPGGDVFEWGGSFETGTLLASLTGSYYTDPALLADAVPVDVMAMIADGTPSDSLSINPADGFVGTFHIRLTTIVGGETTEEVFSVTVENQAPSIAAISDVGLLSGESQTIVLSAADADGDALSFDVEVIGSLASQMMTEHQLHEAAGVTDFALNWGGQNEKWIQGNAGWYFLLPDGSLNLWGGSFESSTMLAQLSVSDYDDPHQLLSATTPDVEANIIVDELHLTAGGQTGEFQVEVTVFDGVASTTSTFGLEVTNTAPTVSISDQIVATGSPLDIVLPAVDADGQSVSYSVEIIGDELSALDAEHGFWSDGDYFTDYLGQNERWIRDSENTWHYLLPDGNLYRWEGSFEASTLVAELGNDVYDDPALLTDPQPAAVIASFNNNVLTVQANDGYTGTVIIRVIASDGFAESSTTFEVNVLSAEDFAAAFAGAEDDLMI